MGLCGWRCWWGKGKFEIAFLLATCISRMHITIMSTYIVVSDRLRSCRPLNGQERKGKSFSALDLILRGGYFFMALLGAQKLPWQGRLPDQKVSPSSLCHQLTSSRHRVLERRRRLFGELSPLLEQRHHAFFSLTKLTPLWGLRTEETVTK